MAKMYGLARIGRDAELRFTPSGEAVANLSLAFSYGKKENGNRSTQWVDGSLWGRRAEALAQYLTKGTMVMVTLDDVHIEEFQGKNGPGHKLAGRIEGVEFAGGSQQQDQGRTTATATHGASSGQVNRQINQAADCRAAQEGSGGGGGFSDLDDFDSDIPF